ncbi:MAG TPA: hypothetical protein VF335_07580 [Chitinivibrionales bacterium]
MKRCFVFSACVCAFLTMVFVHPTLAGGKFVRVDNPLAKVYEYLDPKSKVLRVAKKGDHFPLVFEGTLWYQIKVQDKVGWLDRKDGSVVNDSATSDAGTFIVIAILLLGTIGGVSLYIYKQKSSEV